MAVDLSRMMTLAFHPAGFEVYMYLDDPGVYFDVHGNPIAEAVAKRAGLDVKRFAKMASLAKQRAQVESLIAAELETAERETVAEKGGFVLVNLGKGFFAVEDGAGNAITKDPVPEVTARTLFDELTAGADDDEGAADKDE